MNNKNIGNTAKFSERNKQQTIVQIVLIGV